MDIVKPRFHKYVMKFNIFPKKKKRNPKLLIAKIVFNDMFHSIPVDNPMMKEIHLFEGKEFLGSYDYSDVIIDEFMNDNIIIKDETEKPINFRTKRVRSLGLMEVE